MWIRIQKKEALIECKCISLREPMFKKSKVTISGSFVNTVDFGGDILGEYESMEEAKRIFEDIQNSIAEGKNLYIMP